MEKNKKNICAIVFILCCFCLIKAQTLSFNAKEQSIRVCFYNLENLFDCEDDPLTNDNSFTPEGANHWTSSRMKKKINNISKAIIAMGKGESPAIVGVCEVENAEVLKLLTKNTALANQNYDYVHYDSKDPRGIDVALLYRKNKFQVIYSEAIQLIYHGQKKSGTRDILYVKGIVPRSKDTLHIFVNHWPSRYSGYAQTMPKRNQAADLLRHYIDSLVLRNANAKILCMGDFNDYPDDESITKHLRAFSPKKIQNESDLVHLMYPFFTQNNIGTHKYQQHWGILDQMMVNQSFYHAKSGLKIEKSAHIFKEDFLLEDDTRNMGKRPYRTYLSMKYIGGFSDHLPIYVDINF